MATETYARSRGYTEEIIAEGEDLSLSLLIRPSTGLDSTYVAYDRDTGEFIRLNGWMFLYDFDGVELKHE